MMKKRRNPAYVLNKYYYLSEISEKLDKGIIRVGKLIDTKDFLVLIVKYTAEFTSKNIETYEDDYRFSINKDNTKLEGPFNTLGEAIGHLMHSIRG